MVFTFRNFERLQEKKGYRSTAVACHGHQWRVEFYPWGYNDEAKENERVSLFLFLSDFQEPTKVELTFRFGETQGKLEHLFAAEDRGCGFTDLISRTDAISKLDKDGSLTVHVDLRCWLKSKPIWRPENALQEKLRRLWGADKGTDVTFRLDGGGIVRAHRSVLSIQCPDLYDIVEEAGSNGDIEIDNTDADLFALFVRFMYHESLPTDFDLEKNGFELLKLANRFGYSDLKIHIEADLVGSDLLTVETAADFLLLADANDCALLKEAAMDMVVANQVEITKSNGWKALKESSTLLADVFEQQTAASAREDSNTVSALRKRCAEMGLEVDGTKEMLRKRCEAVENTV